MFSNLPDVARPEANQPYPTTGQPELFNRRPAKLPSPQGSVEVERAVAEDLVHAKQLIEQQTAQPAAIASVEAKAAQATPAAAPAESGWFEHFSGSWPFGEPKPTHPHTAPTVFGLDLAKGDANAPQTAQPAAKHNLAAAPQLIPPAEQLPPTEQEPKRLPGVFTSNGEAKGLWSQLSTKNAVPAASNSVAPPTARQTTAPAAATNPVTAEDVSSRITGLVHPFISTNTRESTSGTAAAPGAPTTAGQQAVAQPSNSASAAAAGSTTENPWGELWRPMTLTDTRRTQAEQSFAAQSQHASAIAARKSTSDSEELPALLQPFLATQASSRQQPHRGADQGVAAGSMIYGKNTPAPVSETLPVAFLEEASGEEPLPQPTGKSESDLQAEDLGIPGGTKTPAAGSGGAGSEESKTLVGADKLGEEPTDNSLQFLRFTGILLEPGETQFDVGVTYAYSENQFPFFVFSNNGTTVEDANFRLRELEVPFEMRCGLYKRVQLFVGSSVGWSNAEFSVADVEMFENDGGIGDVYGGLTMQFREQDECHPHIIGTLGFTAPTGGDPFSTAEGFQPTGPALGNGFWSIFGSVLAIRTYDPVTIFYGAGTNQSFEHEYVGREFQPGQEWNYTFGAGFAVNERMTLSTQFNGAWVDDLKVDGDRVEGSTQEPMSIRFAATISKKNRIVEPFIRFGITEAATNSYFGIIWTF